MRKKIKTVFVSGSSTGVGFGIAKVLSNNGYAVIVNGRNEERVSDAVKQLNKNSDGLVGDVTNLIDLQEIRKQIKLRSKKIYAIVPNVGSGSSVEPGKEKLIDWEQSFSINFYSTIQTIYFLKDLLENNGSSIVCISSICGIDRVEGAPITYSVAKSALNFFIKCSAPIFALEGIRLNGVAPGNVIFPGSSWDEKMMKSEEQVLNMLNSKVPLKRFGTPNEIGELVEYILSDKASFMTGSVVTIDGGQSL